MVCSELSSEERRLLLLFITGTDRLPEAGCETLSIEVRGNKALLVRLGGGDSGSRLPPKIIATATAIVAARCYRVRPSKFISMVT